MFKKLIVVGLFALLPLCVSNAYAWTQGESNGAVDQDGVFHLNRYGQDTEVITLSNTITADETGKVFIISATNVTSTLPAVADGLIYTFLIGAGDWTHNIDPNGTDTIAYSTCTGGDKIQNPTSDMTGACVTLIGDKDLAAWHVYSMNKTWTDND